MVISKKNFHQLKVIGAQQIRLIQVVSFLNKFMKISILILIVKNFYGAFALEANSHHKSKGFYKHKGN